ncbi:hypothetical protein M3D48_02370 [Dermabacter vaginalis]|uniref:hypothetical protein n=1 Tax=Dermabacter vaginalis TaxID=1630135 RepID=UPI0021A8B2BC|nr:hypothetical protein [Dermabacter vaginalis]MCT2149478.1 hypothetical protein [Dermabacter vaginalis]
MVHGAAYRVGVKETALSCVFPTVAELEARGEARVRVHNPFYSDEELAQEGWVAWHEGDNADLASRS